MKRLDYATAFFILGLSAVAMWDTRNLGYWEEFGPGPAFAPYLIAIMGIICALVLLVETYRSEDTPSDWPDAAGGWRVSLTVALLVLFTLGLPWLGFIITGTIFMLLLLLRVLRRAMAPSLVTTAATIMMIQGVFVIWLGVRLPTGPFGF